jgi:nitroimidazol reductase NimA-like FMN-containing flavoprotein (pyridoxamine 5'-phosphate oxidase superfamily)
MFREMRRKDKLMKREETIKIIENGTHGVLSVIGDQGYPYGIPMNYAYQDEKLYFHCALTGHKIDALLNNPKSCFTIIGSEQIIPEELNTNFMSVIVFGQARIAESSEKISSLRIIGNRFASMFPEIVEKGIANELSKTAIIILEIEHITGKAAR